MGEKSATRGLAADRPIRRAPEERTSELLRRDPRSVFGERLGASSESTSDDPRRETTALGPRRGRPRRRLVTAGTAAPTTRRSTKVGRRTTRARPGGSQTSTVPSSCAAGSGRRPVKFFSADRVHTGSRAASRRPRRSAGPTAGAKGSTAPSRTSRRRFLRGADAGRMERLRDAIYLGDGSRRRRGCELDSPWRGFRGAAAMDPRIVRGVFLASPCSGRAGAAAEKTLRVPPAAVPAAVHSARVVRAADGGPRGPTARAVSLFFRVPMGRGDAAVLRGGLEPRIPARLAARRSRRRLSGWRRRRACTRRARRRRDRRAGRPAGRRDPSTTISYPRAGPRRSRPRSCPRSRRRSSPRRSRPRAASTASIL